MHKLSERGVVHLLVPLILLLGIIGGVFLVTNGNPLKLFSKAAPTLPSAPEASFELELEKSGIAPFTDEATPTNIPIGSKFRVDIYARSDTEAANLFKASIHFTQDTDRISFIEPVEINRREGQSFVKNWVETASSGTTFITMTGGVASPGIQTDAKSGALLMGSIIFEAKRLGKVKIELADDSAIYSNVNNINILTAKKGTIEVEITDIQPSPTPTPVSHSVSCTGVLVEGGVQGKLPTGETVYTLESEGKLKLTAQVTNPEGVKVTGGWIVADDSNGGTFDPMGGTSVTYNAPKNLTSSDKLLKIQSSVSAQFSDGSVTSTGCGIISVNIKPAVQPTPTPQPTPSPSPVTGFGKALKLTKDNSYVKAPFRIPDIPFADGRGLAISLWVKPTSLSNDGNARYLVAREIVGSGVQGFSLGVTNRKLDFTIAIKTDGGEIKNGYVTSNTLLDYNKWYHIAAEYYPSVSASESGQINLFINGVREGTQQIRGVRSDNVSDSNVTIGCKLIRNFGCLNQFFGEIDDVVVMSGSHYYLNFTPPTTPFNRNVASIIGIYHLEGNAQDSSVRENHGTTSGEIQFVDSTVAGGTTQFQPPQAGNGDGNSDGKVDLADLSILLADFNKSGEVRIGVDLNGDGSINTFDFSLMRDLLIQKGVIKG